MLPGESHEWQDDDGGAPFTAPLKKDTIIMEGWS